MFGSFKTVFGVMAVRLVFAASGGGELAAKGGKARLSANQFVSLQPFNIPMMPKDDKNRQFTLVVALELADEGDRDFVRSRIPVIRSKTYDLLFRLIAYREQAPLIPSTALIKRKIMDIMTRAVGPDKVASIVVQQVYHGRTP
jgi:flagellar basal body-associated protein FliL